MKILASCRCGYSGDMGSKVRKEYLGKIAVFQPPVSLCYFHMAVVICPCEKHDGGCKVFAVCFLHNPRTISDEGNFILLFDLNPSQQ